MNNTTQKISPWCKAMNQALIGIALCGFTLNFLGLNYILPTIGLILALLGFRTLRKENKWFFLCYVITLIRIAYLLFSLSLNATIYHSMPNTHFSDFLTIGNYILFTLLFLMIVFLWRGFLSVQKKANLPPHAGGAVGMLVWYLILFLLAVTQYQGLLILGAMMIAYILLIFSLFKLSNELDDAEYTISLPTTRISDPIAAIAIIVLLFTGIGCGYLWGGKYKMEWSQDNRIHSEEIEQIKSHLTELGFPTNVLNDLKEEDILSCKGAIRLVFDECDEPLNDGRTVEKQNGNSTDHYTVYDEKELHITNIAVELPGQSEQWKLFHHFNVTDSTKFYGTEAIQIWPAYRIHEGWDFNGEVSGHLLYDNRGTTFLSPYYSLGAESYGFTDMIWGGSITNDIFAEFSLPNNVENRRGYLCYTITEIQTDSIIQSYFHYTHQKTWFQYPVITAKELRLFGDWNRSDTFISAQYGFYLSPDDDVLEPLS